MKITHPVTRAAFGVAALVSIAVLANWLVSLTPLGDRGADFTENKVHTLSDGTRSILAELDTRVVIRYYASRSTDYMPEQLKLHMRRVDDLLKEYESLSKGKLRIENLDPEPDTDAEDSANLDGVNGQRMDDQNLYFGLAVSCLDKTSVIPFLNPADETMLEYNLSRAIAEVTTPTKPKIGVISALSIRGMPAMMPGQQSTPPWVIYQQLKQTYDVVDVSMEPMTIDPKEIKAILLFHPAGITPDVEYSIDQYLLKGGTVIACLDAYSAAAEATSRGNPMMGQQGAPTSSTLPTLLPAWGVTFESTQVLADPAYSTTSGNQNAIAILTMGKDAMPHPDDVITKTLDSVRFYLPGAFTFKGGNGLTYTSLIQSSTGAGFVDPMRAGQADPALARKLKPTGTSYDLVSHLTGTFKTAFPEGKPKTEIDGTPAPDEKDKPKPEPLKEGSSPGNVFLIADVDAFFDSIAYSVGNFGGSQVVQATNGNSSLLLNLVDQAIGSKYLIGSRSRSATQRPFTVVKKMEQDFEKSAGDKVEELQAREDAAMERINQLQAERSRSSGPYATPEQEAEIIKVRGERAKYSKLIRDQQKELRRKKDKLAGNITLLNVAVMPSLVILFGLGLYMKRRSSTRAR